jgi:hypothetical protein
MQLLHLASTATRLLLTTALDELDSAHLVEFGKAASWPPDTQPCPTMQEAKAIVAHRETLMDRRFGSLEVALTTPGVEHDRAMGLVRAVGRLSGDAKLLKLLEVVVDPITLASAAAPSAPSSFEEMARHLLKARETLPGRRFTSLDALYTTAPAAEKLVDLLRRRFALPPDAVARMRAASAVARVTDVLEPGGEVAAAGTLAEAGARLGSEGRELAD